MAAGVTVTVRDAPLPPKTILAFGMIVVLLELPVRVSVPTALSTSPTVTASAAVALSSLIIWGPGPVIVGASFKALTVTVKVVGVVFTPSLTFKVIVTAGPL